MTIYRVRELLHNECLRHEAMSRLDTDPARAAEHLEVARAMRLASRIILTVFVAEHKRGKHEPKK